MQNSVLQKRKRSIARKLPELPKYYYHTNFCDMLTFVQTRYGHVFETEHLNFLQTFQNLPHGAQCLYIRIAGRKGKVFDTHKFKYPEIPDIASALRALEQTGFMAWPKDYHYHECLQRMTKPELIALMADHICASGFKRSWKKDRLVEAALKHMPFEHTSLPSNLIIQGPMIITHPLILKIVMRRR